MPEFILKVMGPPSSGSKPVTEFLFFSLIFFMLLPLISQVQIFVRLYREGRLGIVKILGPGIRRKIPDWDFCEFVKMSKSFNPSFKKNYICIMPLCGCL